MRLDEKVAIVTGAGSGLGAAIAERFASAGAVAVVADIDADGARATVDRIRAANGQARCYQVDVTRRVEISRFFSEVVADLGRLDILVNNAGITRYRPFLEADDEDWDAVIDVDLKGMFFCVQAAAPYFIGQKSGRIVNVSSSLGTGTSPHNTAGSPAGSAAYGSAKAGVILLSKTLARELGPHNVTVNCVAPGTFLTAMTRATRSPQELEVHIAARRKNNVLGRLGQPEELAAAVLFLASDEASFITGQTLSVDGGRTDRM